MRTFIPESADQAKTIEDCIEYASVDAYNEEEQAGGWLSIIEEIFDNVNQVKLLGEEVDLKGFDLDGTTVVAICKKGGKKARISLDSIEFVDPTKIQSLWLSAYRKWQKV